VGSQNCRPMLSFKYYVFPCKIAEYFTIFYGSIRLHRFLQTINCWRNIEIPSSKYSVRISCVPMCHVNICQTVRRCGETSNGCPRGQGIKVSSQGLPPGKRLHSYGKSQFFMGKSTISMAMFNSYVCLPEGKHQGPVNCWFKLQSGNPNGASTHKIDKV